MYLITRFEPPRAELPWSYLEFYPRGLLGRVGIDDLTGAEVRYFQQESLRDPRKQNMREYAHVTHLTEPKECLCHAMTVPAA